MNPGRESESISVETSCGLFSLPLSAVALAFAPRWFHFCDPSRGRRKRRQAALKLDGFIYHTFSGSIESLGAVDNTATISTSAPQDEPEAERDHSGSQGNPESVGIRPELSDGVVVDRIWHDNSQPVDDASQPVDDTSQSADDAIPAAAAAAAPTTVAVESDSNYESEFMDFINWPEE
ncbi:hypothetical protein P692DRAFT_20881405 [Suillus brevipes Sb2]|nr:hypothetical protein P692DRAFT_20881405 [Suillus brevipes Sb2]